MNKILIIFTGGTISMTVDKKLNAAIPGMSGADILSMMKNVDEYGDLEILDFGQFPGPQMNPKRILELSKRIKSELERDDIQGVIVTHGTDTLEETAYFLDLNINSEKPIVVVGAMRNASELGYDGLSNLASAIVTVKSEHSKAKGVLVVLNNQVNSAREVTKTHTMSLDTFKSIEFGPLGIVDNNEVLYSRDIMPHGCLPVDDIEEQVYLIKSYTGMERLELDFYTSIGARGIIIEAMGRGNLPPETLGGIQDAINQGVTIVIVSRCPSGRVLGTYGYDGGGQQTRDMGVLFGTAMNGQKTRIKLMLALKYSDDPKTIQYIMEHDTF